MHLIDVIYSITYSLKRRKYNGMTVLVAKRNKHELIQEGKPHKNAYIASLMENAE